MRPPLCGWPVDRPGPVIHCAEPACIVYLVQVAEAPVRIPARTAPAGLFLCLAHDPAQLAAPAVRWLDANGQA